MAGASFLNKFIKVTVITVAVSIVLVISLLPFVIRWQAVGWLERQGLEAEIGYINIRPILGSVQINDVRIAASQTEQFVLDKVLVNIAWRPLLANWVEVERVLIDGAALDIVATPNSVRVGGLPLPSSPSHIDEPEKEDTSEPAIGRMLLSQLDINNSEFCYSRQGEQGDITLRQCIAFDALSLLGQLDLHLGESPSAEIGGAALKGFHWADQQNPAELLGVEQLTVKGIASDDLSHWRVDNIAVESLGLLPVRDAEGEISDGDLWFSTLALSALEVGNDNRIQNVFLSDLQLNMNLVGHGEPLFSPKLMARLDQLLPAVPDEKNTDTAPPSSTLSIGDLAIDSVSISGDLDAGNFSRQNLLSLNNFNINQLSQRGSAITLSKLQLSDLSLLPEPAKQGEPGDLQLAKLMLSDLSIGDKSLEVGNHLGNASLSGVKLALRENEQGMLTFAPVFMAQIAQLAPEASEQEASADEDAEALALVLENLSIDEFGARDGDHGQPLLSFQGFDLQNLSIVGADIGLGSLNLSDLAVLPVTSDQEVVSADLQLKNFALSNSVFGSDNRLGSLSLEMLDVNLDAEKNGQLTFAPELLSRLVPSAPGVDSSDNSASNGKNETVFAIDDLAVGGVSIRDRGHERDLLLINETVLSGFSLEGDALVLSHFQVKDLKVLEPKSDAPVSSDFYFSTPSLVLSGVEKTVSHFSLKSLLVADPEIFIYRDDSGGLALISDLEQMVQGDGVTKGEASSESVGDPSPEISYAIGRVNIGVNGRLLVLDESVTPHFNKHYEGLNLSIDHMDSSQPNEPSALSFDLKLDKFGYIKLQGSLKPFGETLNAAIDAEMRGLDARALSIYASQYIGYSLDQGIAEADIDFAVREDDVNADVVTRFHKLEVSPLSEHELPEGAESLGVPLDFALGLLRDKNGMIELKLPINGDIHSPNFSLGHIIGKVMFKVISETIINYYMPFGLIVSGTLQDTLSNLSFEPVMFDPGAISLSDAAMANLDKLSEMLISREQLALSFCAPSTWYDWAAKYAPDELTRAAEGDDTEASEAETSEVPAAVVSPEQRATLKLLANQRSDVVKEYLIGKGVKGGQVILCEGDFEQSNKALPQMDIAI